MTIQDNDVAGSSNELEGNPAGQLRIETWHGDGGIDNPQRITDEFRGPIGPNDSGAHLSVGEFPMGAYSPILRGLDHQPAPPEHGRAGGNGDVQSPPSPGVILPDAPPPDALPEQYHWTYAKTMGEFHLDELLDNDGKVVRSHVRAMEIAQERAKSATS